MDQTLSNILALAAIIVSGMCVYYTNKLAIKQNNINLESQIYMDIFKDYLVKYLPEERRKIYFDGKIMDYSFLADKLMELKKDSLYFYFRNHSFYETLKNKLEDFENYLVELEGKVIEGTDVTKVCNEIDSKMIDLYDYIINKYFGN